jgi:hypothetical protein
MPWKQVHTPNVLVRAQRAYCLKYVDDAGNAPKRTATARTALNNEVKAKRLRTTPPPLNIWVVGFMDMRAGGYAAYDHVFLMKYKGGGVYEIRDSETNSGARAPYTSINSILAWFGAYKPVYVGWSTHCDGRQYAASYNKPAPKPVKKPAPKKPAKKSEAQIAKEVVAGKWGNGPARAQKLKKAGYNPARIQAIVNKLIK